MTSTPRIRSARLNLGIRRRLAPLMENDRRRIELMNGMLLSLPGTPIIYYGDEIGMGDNMYLGDRNGVRTPMQWSGGWNAGFSTADPEQLYSALISNPVYGYQVINRGVAEALAAFPAFLDEAHPPGSQVQPGVQPRLHRIPKRCQPPRACVPAAVE